MQLSNRIKNKVADWALNSLYRMNVQTADCYAFNLYYNDKGKIDFDGGWDWTNDIIDKKAEFLFILKTKEFITL